MKRSLFHRHTRTSLHKVLARPVLPMTVKYAPYVKEIKVELPQICYDLNLLHIFMHNYRCLHFESF